MDLKASSAGLQDRPELGGKRKRLEWHLKGVPALALPPQNRAQ